VSTVPTDPPPPSAPRGGRLKGIGAFALVVVATLLLIVSALAVWVDRVALQTATWTNTSTELLAEPAITTPLSVFIANQVDTRLQIEEQVTAALPPRAAPLAPTIAAAVNDVVQRTAERVLVTPRTEAIWARIMSNAHRELIAVLDGRTPASQPDGSVTIDLAPLIADTAAEVGVPAARLASLPPDAGKITILPGERLDTVRTAVRALRAVANWLALICFLLYAAAIWLAADRRRQLLRVGFGLVVAAIVLAVARAGIGGYLPGAVAKTAEGEDATRAAWHIVSEPLGDAILTIFVLGLLTAVAAWLGGAGARATRVRAFVGPWIADPRYAYGGLAVVILALIAWGPVPATRNPLTVVLVGGTAVLGLELLRRQVQREGVTAERPVAAPG
jgi:hypothetical protein